MTNDQQFAIGIDLGGTKIEVVVLTPDGTELFRHRVPTPRDYAATLDAIAALVEAAERKISVPATVGIGTPGAISAATGLVKNAYSTSLNGQPFGADIEARLGRKVRIANDANCFALSEAIDGAAAGAKVVFGAILGTGVGGGIVIDGRILVGANSIAGEWGHNPLPCPDAPDASARRCRCGRMDCIESYLSAPALAENFREATGLSRRPEEITECADRHDPDCDAALTRYEYRLARALATIVNVIDPDVIVLGGGMSNTDRLYSTVPRLWQPYIYSDTIVTRLVRNRHGDSSGVRGAAYLWSRSRARGRAR